MICLQADESQAVHQRFYDSAVLILQCVSFTNVSCEVFSALVNKCWRLFCLSNVCFRF